MKYKFTLLPIIFLFLIGCTAQPTLTKPDDIRSETWEKSVKYSTSILEKIDTLDIKFNNDKIEFSDSSFLEDTETKEILAFYVDKYNSSVSSSEKELLDNLFNLAGNYMFVKVNITKYNSEPNLDSLNDLKNSLQETQKYADKLTAYARIKTLKSLDKCVKNIDKQL